MIIIVINGRRIPRKPHWNCCRNKNKANVAEKASALVAATDHGAGKTYYLDLQSKDSNKLQQALMADGSEGEKKKSEIWFGIDVWDMLPLNDMIMLDETKDEVNLLFQNFHKMIETQYNAKVRVLRSDNGGEYQILIFKSIWKDMTSFIRLLVPIHPNKMESLNEKSALVRSCSCFLDSSKNIDILLGKAITSATYLINRVPSSSINFQTPLQALTNAVVVPTVPNLLLVFLVAWHLCIYTNTNTPS
ncbi:Retrovirus-related Pol polyprotein from transposon TNT 1-94 [Vitis vinifera]|uniref:Retrovirus-related Pol polyprotein from transposon TNT 1-94 n=1 Tax=Vitis vinifera TaxID=29760 RepID=A0A438IGU6_VITVI|nr:Retrovirus-related Pol polyprotein from transposon TNT 1-94 [Vitis vinifera]